MRIEDREGRPYSWGEVANLARQEIAGLELRARRRGEARERLAYIDAADCADGRRWRWVASGQFGEAEDDLSGRGEEDAAAVADRGIAELRMIAE